MKLVIHPPMELAEGDISAGGRGEEGPQGGEPRPGENGEVYHYDAAHGVLGYLLDSGERPMSQADDVLGEPAEEEEDHPQRALAQRLGVGPPLLLEDEAEE